MVIDQGEIKPAYFGQKCHTQQHFFACVGNPQGVDLVGVGFQMKHGLAQMLHIAGGSEQHIHFASLLGWFCEGGVVDQCQVGMQLNGHGTVDEEILGAGRGIVYCLFQKIMEIDAGANHGPHLAPLFDGDIDPDFGVTQMHVGVHIHLIVPRLGHRGKKPCVSRTLARQGIAQWLPRILIVRIIKIVMSGLDEAGKVAVILKLEAVLFQYCKPAFPGLGIVFVQGHLKDGRFQGQLLGQGDFTQQRLQGALLVKQNLFVGEMRTPLPVDLICQVLGIDLDGGHEGDKNGRHQDEKMGSKLHTPSTLNGAAVHGLTLQ